MYPTLNSGTPPMLGIRTRHRGFTLIELLVVIGIIALLIGILLPVLAKVRAGAKGAACMVNMRSMAQATTAYSLDFDRKLPQPSGDGGITNTDERNAAVWFNALDAYVGNSKKSGAGSDRNFNAYKQDPVWLDLPTTVQTTSGPVQAEPEKVRTIKMKLVSGIYRLGDHSAGFHRKPSEVFQNHGYPQPGANCAYTRTGVATIRYTPSMAARTTTPQPGAIQGSLVPERSSWPPVTKEGPTSRK